MTLMLFRVFVVGMVLFGSVAKVALVWDMADLFMALMAITNLVRSRFWASMLILPCMIIWIKKVPASKSLNLTRRSCPVSKGSKFGMSVGMKNKLSWN